MAERRMFAKSVIGGARFLRMPATSRLLYYDLGMEADDDGCVEAFGVMRKTGANEDDLGVLVSKGFIRLLNEDLVTYILDWNTNNRIRSDRYHEGMYKGLIDGTCEVIFPADNQVATNGQPSDNQTATEVRLGKDSLGKSSLGKSSLGQDRSGKGSAEGGTQPQKSETGFAQSFQQSDFEKRKREQMELLAQYGGSGT
jgi:hypothetical protein